jgi:hypothetical protein
MLHLTFSKIKQASGRARIGAFNKTQTQHVKHNIWLSCKGLVHETSDQLQVLDLESNSKQEQTYSKNEW